VRADDVWRAIGEEEDIARLRCLEDGDEVLAEAQEGVAFPQSVLVSVDIAGGGIRQVRVFC